MVFGSWHQVWVCVCVSIVIHALRARLPACPASSAFLPLLPLSLSLSAPSHGRIAARCLEPASNSTTPTLRLDAAQPTREASSCSTTRSLHLVLRLGSTCNSPLLVPPQTSHAPNPYTMSSQLKQGFHKPHDHEIRKHVSMFDQPYRQHKVSRGFKVQGFGGWGLVGQITIYKSLLARQQYRHGT